MKKSFSNNVVFVIACNEQSNSKQTIIVDLKRFIVNFIIEMI